MKKVLIIAHYFPPIGGAGVQRAAKFAKYLPDFGWQPIVVTGDQVPNEHWTPEDQSLMNDVAVDAVILRANWSTADSEGGLSEGERRVEALQKKADEAIRKYQPDLLMVTMSPFQDAPIAIRLSLRYDLPWVADLRDPWALDEFQMYRSFWHAGRDRKKMRQDLSSASLVIMNTPVAARRLVEEFPEFEGRTVEITNGFDREDFPEILSPPKKEVFTIIHSGHFHAGLGLRQERRQFINRILGRVKAGVSALSRSHYYLIKALLDLKEKEPERFQSLRVKCLGVSQEADQALVDDAGLSEIFTFTGYLPHSKCVEEVRQADLLFLPMHTVASGSEASIVPGKTYEYLASGRPILAAVPPGDAADFLQQSGMASLCGPTEVEEMGKHLLSSLEKWESGEASPKFEESFIDQFERRKLTKKLASELDRLKP